MLSSIKTARQISVRMPAAGLTEHASEERARSPAANVRHRAHLETIPAAIEASHGYFRTGTAVSRADTRPIALRWQGGWPCLPQWKTGAFPPPMAGPRPADILW